MLSTDPTNMFLRPRFLLHLRLNNLLHVTAMLFSTLKPRKPKVVESVTSSLREGPKTHPFFRKSLIVSSHLEIGVLKVQKKKCLRHCNVVHSHRIETMISFQNISHTNTSWVYRHRFYRERSISTKQYIRNFWDLFVDLYFDRWTYRSIYS